MKIILVTNEAKYDIKHVAESIVKKLQHYGVEVIEENQKLTGAPNLILVLGGDGTIIRAARQYGMQGIPVLGINMGTVGFLSNIEAGEIDLYIERLIQQNYFIEERMLLESTVFEYNQRMLFKETCINEVTVKSDSMRMISISLEVNGSSLGTYRGDGLIVATPTGSTAYSLSAGGPISDPGLEALFVTPIACHNISRRPLVVSPGRILRLTLRDDGVLCFDGQIKIDLNKGSTIEIKKSPYTLRLADLKKKPYFETFETRLRRIESFFNG